MSILDLVKLDLLSSWVIEIAIHICTTITITIVIGYWVVGWKFLRIAKHMHTRQLPFWCDRGLGVATWWLIVIQLLLHYHHLLCFCCGCGLGLLDLGICASHLSSAYLLLNIIKIINNFPFIYTYIYKNIYIYTYTYISIYKYLNHIIPTSAHLQIIKHILYIHILEFYCN